MPFMFGASTLLGIDCRWRKTVGVLARHVHAARSRPMERNVTCGRHPGSADPISGAWEKPDIARISLKRAMARGPRSVP